MNLGFPKPVKATVVSDPVAQTTLQPTEPSLNYYKFCVQRNKIHNTKNNLTKESNAKSKYNYSPILCFVTLS